MAASLGNYAAFPAPAKLVLSATMLLGRLEIYGFIIIFLIRSWK
jgi:Trk-type K+ transport system membrane component